MIGRLVAQDTTGAFSRAYDLRNHIIHEGLSSEDREFEIRKVANRLRTLYGRLSRRKFTGWRPRRRIPCRLLQIATSTRIAV